MKPYIALLRGINVGGKKILPMKELVALLEELGASEVKTYIQSGNVVLRHSAERASLATEISGAILETYGFEPRVMLLDAAEMTDAMATNPFPEAEAEPKTLHLYFLADVPPNPDIETLDALKKENERYQLVGKVFYLHAPDGIGRSKLAERAEKLLGVPATARNWRTVAKIMAMVN